MKCRMSFIALGAHDSNHDARIVGLNDEPWTVGGGTVTLSCPSEQTAGAQVWFPDAFLGPPLRRADKAFGAGARRPTEPSLSAAMSRCRSAIFSTWARTSGRLWASVMSSGTAKADGSAPTTQNLDAGATSKLHNTGGAIVCSSFAPWASRPRSTSYAPSPLQARWEWTEPRAAAPSTVFATASSSLEQVPYLSRGRQGPPHRGFSRALGGLTSRIVGLSAPPGSQRTKHGAQEMAR